MNNNEEGVTVKMRAFLEKNVVDKWGYLVLAVFSFYSACLVVFQDAFHFNGDVFGGIDKNYVCVDNLFIRLVLVVVCTVLCAVIVLGLSKLCNKWEDKIFGRNECTNKKKCILLIGSTLFLILCWSPYILTYYPGGVYSDGFVSIDQIVYNYLNNHHPILYTVFVGLFIKIGLHFDSLYMGIALYTLAQTGIMALVLSYVLLWMYNRNINKIYISICGIVFAFYPLFPYYAIALWKDTLFSLVFVLFVLFQIDVFRSKGELLCTGKGILHYCVLALGIMFLRNNGIYIVAFSIFVYLLINFNNIKKLKKYVGSVSAMLVITFLIQGPVYDYLGLSTEFVENLGIPMQQISAVIAYDGELTEEQEQFLEQIWNLEELGNKYTPCLADTPKGYVESFNADFLENHKKEFLKVWIEVCVQNPKIAIKAFLMENLGFWHPTVSGSVAYIQPGVWINNYGVERNDLFVKIFGFSIESVVLPRYYLSCGFLFWLVLLSMTVAVLRKGIGSIIVESSIIGAWITMMIATPVAISLRYMYILVLVLPLLPLFPIFGSQMEGMEENKVVF